MDPELLLPAAYRLRENRRALKQGENSGTPRHVRVLMRQIITEPGGNYCEKILYTAEERPVDVLHT